MVRDDEIKKSYSKANDFKIFFRLFLESYFFFVETFFCYYTLFFSCDDAGFFELFSSYSYFYIVLFFLSIDYIKNMFD